MNDIPTVLNTLRADSDEELAPLYFEMEDLWERRLYHQLTTRLLELFSDPRSAPLRLSVYTKLIASLERYINALAFAKLTVIASESFNSPQEAVAFLDPVIEMKKDTDQEDVLLYLGLHRASLHVRMGDLVTATKAINAASRALDASQMVDQAVSTAFYKVQCEYYKAKGDYTAYYRNSLLFLAYINLEEEADQCKEARAYDMSIAALLGDRIYNFGELILHPILDSLDTNFGWLKQLVEVVNAGSISGFHKLLPQLSKAPVLESALPFLQQKLCLMALCECVFRRATNDRVLSFDYIAKETQLQAGSKVEVLVLKAFSMGLVKGTIDQVDRTVNFTWLQPRILNKEQIASMRQQLGQWAQDVEKLASWIDDEGKEIWVR